MLMTINTNPISIDSDAADNEWLYDTFFIPGDELDAQWDEEDEEEQE